MIADLDDQLERVDVVFYLTNGLGNKQKTKKINPRRYGEKTCFEAATHTFSLFSAEQKKAIIEYLRFKYVHAGMGKHTIEQALNNYWLIAISE